MDLDELNEAIRKIEAAVNEQAQRSTEGQKAMADRLGQAKDMLSSAIVSLTSEQANTIGLSKTAIELLRTLEQGLAEKLEGGDADQERFGRLEKALAERNEDLKGAKERAGQLQKDLEQSRDALIAAKESASRAEELQGALNQRAEEVQALQVRIQDLSSSVDAAKADEETAIARVKSLEDVVADLSVQAEEQSTVAADLDKLREAEATARGESETLRVQAREASTAEREKAEALAQAQGQIGSLKEELERVKGDAAQSSKSAGEADTLTQELEAERERTHELQSALDEANAALDEVNAAAAPAVSTDELGRAQQQISDLQSELAALNPSPTRTAAPTRGRKKKAPDTDSEAKLRKVTAGSESEVTPQRMGDILVVAGIVTQDQLDSAINAQRANPQKRIGAILVDEGYATEEIVAQTLACQRNLEFVRLEKGIIQADAPNLIQSRLAEHHGCIPIRATADSLVLAMGNPLDLIAIEDVERASERIVEPVVAMPSEISSSIQSFYTG